MSNYLELILVYRVGKKLHMENSFHIEIKKQKQEMSISRTRYSSLRNQNSMDGWTDKVRTLYLGHHA